jgi:biotin synthase
MADAYGPNMIRMSIGSAIVLGLAEGKLDALPTTVYLLTYKDGKCTANCGFCPQAKGSKSRADMLSRVVWPAFMTRRVVDGIEKAVKQNKTKRVCIQALNYPTVFDDVLSVISNIRSRCAVRISVSCQPVAIEILRKLAQAGVERIGIPLDAATEEIFDEIKGKRAGGPYGWQRQLRSLRDAVKVFGKSMVSTHLIVGLGETEEELVEIIQLCVDMGVVPALFAFTPVPGTALEHSLPPSLNTYRRVQLARYLIVFEKTRYKSVRFGRDHRIVDFGVPRKTLQELIDSGNPFLTSGCPNCNRPYYNERPGGVAFNFPRAPTSEEINEIEKVFRE